ncbi:GMC family oxidoreductase [Pseudonocardia xinjiangensis]|uniref:GMC family oxidoreductase n=1 Tax=Pseudonocardia xinjiangensis TaxID=75289 RepID=UPI003D8AF409
MSSFTAGYDFVIVGAGSAGCVLAARLSQDGSAHVLLLEAGSSQRTESMALPPAWPTLIGSSADWGDATVVQAANGMAIPFPRGKTLGGSSAINAMFFVRGHRSSYDAWPAAGAKGWGFDDLLPYFRRTERAHGRDPALRGDEGPVVVAPMEPDPFMTAGLQAAVEVGHRAATDVSGGLEEGFGWMDASIRDGRRCGAAEAYLDAEVRSRPNLTVVTDALVHRVRVHDGRCTGVEYSVEHGMGSEVLVAECREEVVLTAGAVGSAQLLMLSGVGSQAHLDERGVEVVLDLPGVGANFHDHPLSMVAYTPVQPVPTGVGNHSGVIGLMSSPVAADGPDLQLIISDMPLYGPGLRGPDHAYAIVFSAVRPYSRGTVRLGSAEPGAAPLIDPNYYADPRDLDVMAAGLDAARTLGRTLALDPWRGEEVVPGPGVRDAEGVRDYLRRSLGTYFHPAGTCRIGPDGDGMAVVDPDLRVHGISGLRVADASVMPSIVSGNTNSTVYAIAERAADLIRR